MCERTYAIILLGRDEIVSSFYYEDYCEYGCLMIERFVIMAVVDVIVHAFVQVYRSVYS